MKNSKLSGVAWVSLSKISGLARDFLIIALLGFGVESDSIFLNMTLIMLIQLVAYRGNIDSMGRFYVLLAFVLNMMSRPKNLMYLTLITYALLAIYFCFFEGSISSVFGSYLVQFLVVSPSVFILGVLSAHTVLRGQPQAFVKLTAVQNIALITSFCAFYYFFESKAYLPVAWAISYSFALYFSYMNTKNDEYQELPADSIELGDEAVFFAFFSPILMYTIIFVERLFYSEAQGTVGLIKLLETGTMSIIFLLEVLFLNEVLSIVKEKNLSIRSSADLIFRQFKLALPIGVAILSFGVLALIGMNRLDLLPLDEADGLKKHFDVLCLIYIAYFCCVIFRDYLEKIIFIAGFGSRIFYSNIIALVATLLVNYFFLEYAPVSVAVISACILLWKSIYLGIVAKNIIREEKL